MYTAIPRRVKKCILIICNTIKLSALLTGIHRHMTIFVDAACNKSNNKKRREKKINKFHYCFFVFSLFCLCMRLCLRCFFFLSSAINVACHSSFMGFVVVIVVAVAFSVVSCKFIGTRPETMHTKMNNAWFIYTANWRESEWTNKKTPYKKWRRRRRRKQTRKDIKSNESLFLSHASDTV